MTEWAWQPTPEYLERANVARLMRKAGCESISELRQLSIDDIAWYWDAVVKDLGIPFRRPYSRVFDSSAGIEWTKWFIDGRCNLTHACIDRWRDDPERADQAALIGEFEDGAVTSYTYRELACAIDRVARALLSSGIEKGDPVAVFMPMIPEAVIAAYAIAKIGAIYLPIFSGFAAGAVAARLNDSKAKLVFTSDGSWRRGKWIGVKAVCDEAVAQSPSVERVVVLTRLRQRSEGDSQHDDGRSQPFENPQSQYDGVSKKEVDFDVWVGQVKDNSPLVAADTDAEDIFMLAYTSGTTGKPKGAVLPHAGFTVKIASECAYQTDIHAGETFFWFTDMGWIMGQLAMVGSHANGATMLMFEGAPDYPNPDRLWALVDRHNVSMLGISPTLIRALRSAGDEWIGKHDLSSLRTIGSTGEPWNPEPYRWLSQTVAKGRVPIINVSGGTEVGACFLSPYPVEPIKECSLGGISLGMDMDVFSSDGEPVRDMVGELVCKQPWPAMTRGVWGDNERYLESYWSTFPGVWRHGDWAKIDEDGQWFLYGRSDEAINVAGKRLGPAEVESILVSHPEVREAATIGIPDQTKGEVIWCFWVPRNSDGPDVSPELSQLVIAELGRPFKPSRIVRVDALPRTRSQKILRRAVRAVALQQDPGDLSSAENPEALEAIRQSLAKN